MYRGGGGSGSGMNMLGALDEQDKHQMGMGGRRLNDPNQSMMEFSRSSPNDLMPSKDDMNFG